MTEGHGLDRLVDVGRKENEKGGSDGGRVGLAGRTRSRVERETDQGHWTLDRQNAKWDAEQGNCSANTAD